MNKIGKEIAWIGLYIVVFILIQLVIQFAFAGGYLVYYKMPLANLRNLFMSNVTLTIASTIVSSLITIFVFLKKKLFFLWLHRDILHFPQRHFFQFFPFQLQIAVLLTSQFSQFSQETF